MLSGCWRQQFDWAVVEWNRDNGFEHPAFRNLPDGDLSGLEITYVETRTNCIPIDAYVVSDGVTKPQDFGLYPSDWAYLRIWPEGGAEATPYMVPLRQYATAIEGEAQAASVTLELQGTVTGGDNIGVVWAGDTYDCKLWGEETIEHAVGRLAEAINAGANVAVTATASGRQLTLTAKTPGANWNRVGVYGYATGTTQHWSTWQQTFSGGVSPTKWRIHLDLDQLTDRDGNPVPVSAMRNVRKMRWTYSAGWQNGEFQRSEFAVQVSNWTVSGTGRRYSVAGPTSRRIEDDAIIEWSKLQRPFNYSGGSCYSTTKMGESITHTYSATAQHSLYLGTQKLGLVNGDGSEIDGANLIVAVDGTAVTPNPNLKLLREDQMVRIPLGQYGAGSHTVAITHGGPEGTVFRFDFLEVAVPTTELPVMTPTPGVSLATDWDTYHSICLAPERTAWMIDSLGFRGRVNHYVGALWFYELALSGNQYASGQVTFSGTPTFGAETSVKVGRVEAPGQETDIKHINRIGDTPATIAKAFEQEINRGSSAIRAVADGATLTIYSRSLGEDGNQITLSASPGSGTFVATASGAQLTGGTAYTWYTDLTAQPRLNRAARDWHRSFFTALKARGLDAVASLSTELGNGDPSVDTGIAQRCPEGDAVIVNTPALQTNFSPASLAYWRQAHLDLATTMVEGGMEPYLQFGEVQWWYMREKRSGMPFYDEYTKKAFRDSHNQNEMRTIHDENADPADYAEEVAFLPTLIGEFTRQIREYVRATYPNAKFEVLYPLDVNDTPLNRLVNYPTADWTPANLECLKTESFGYTGGRNLDKCMLSIQYPEQRGFPAGRSAHLVGISDPASPWQKEVRMAQAEGVESVVLWALDQLCLIGYKVPLPAGMRRSFFVE